MNTTSLAVIDRSAPALPMAQLKARLDVIVEAMANVLEEGKDYGKIPGTDKPTLYKPGAEKLCLLFQLAAARPLVEDLSTLDEVRYRVSVPIEAPDGRVLSVGIGEASSNEEKYRWRRPVCDEEFADTADHHRREKWFRGQGGKSNFKGKQIRTSPADVANTILKMAHKRAFIHATLLATGASGVFNQDLEDFSKEIREAIVEADETATPKKEVKRASSSGRPPATTTAAGPADTKAPDVLITNPSKVKDVKHKKKANGADVYWLVLEGDREEYSTSDGTIAVELEKFKGTDHLVRVTYKDNVWKDKTYHNIENFAIADATPPAAAPAPSAEPPTPPASSSLPLTASDIPFGR